MTMQPLIASTITRMPTLREAWLAYRQVRKLKPCTIQNYKEIIEYSFRDWCDLPLDQITRAMVLSRYIELCLRGEATANRSMRTLKAMFNFAKTYFEDSQENPVISKNPVQKLSDVGAWREVQRRRTLVLRKQLPRWLAGLFTMRNEASRDMALFLWLTGCRVGEARQLKWRDVDLKHGFVTFRDTKNGKTHVLPLSKFLWDMLSLRKYRAPLDNEYVFPGQKPGQPMGNNYKGYTQMCRRIGCAWKYHDLRRGFISLATILNFNDLTIKRLVNHSQRNDVTARYVVFDPDDLRPAMERIAAKFLELAGHSITVRNVEIRFNSGMSEAQKVSHLTSILDSEVSAVSVVVTNYEK